MYLTLSARYVSTVEGVLWRYVSFSLLVIGEFLGIFLAPFQRKLMGRSEAPGNSPDG